jgi:uncharacterized protein (TIGR02145 family)
MRAPLLLLAGLAFYSVAGLTQSVSDFDGNLYDTVAIGHQTWLKQNLKVTHYKNGDAIAHAPANATWARLRTGAYCNYDNNALYVPTYGRLYNWFAVNDRRGICPGGWHVASDAEWTVLTDLLGGNDVAGGKLKERGTAHWPSPNRGATDQVGFAALGGGYRANNEVFLGFGGIGSWWCSTESTANDAWANGIFNDAVNVDRGGYYEKKMGFSVRCIKDALSGINDRATGRDIRFYPNPARDRLFLTGQDSPVKEVRIFNINGECMLHESLAGRNPEISINSLAKGLYIIELRTKDTTVQGKLIKE